MSTPDLERRLTDLLQERAKGAMEKTKTQEKLSSLLESRQDDVRRRRRRGVAGGLVAAAVATAVAVAVWVAGGGEEETVPEPAPAPSPVDLTAAVATVFVDHTYNQLNGAMGMLADDAVIEDAPSLDAWVKDFMWREAAGFSLADLSCSKGEATPEGTEATCDFTYHGLGSEQLGRGPFGESTIDVVVEDGEITRIDESMTFIENGFSDQMWEPFASWVADRHPADVAVMYTDAGQTYARNGPRSLQLWEQRVAEWVAFQQQ